MVFDVGARTWNPWRTGQSAKGVCYTADALLLKPGQVIAQLERSVSGSKLDKRHQVDAASAGHCELSRRQRHHV